MREAAREKPGPVQSGGGWSIAQSPITRTTITVKRLEKRGYISLLELYNQIKPNTALFPMTWRTAVYETRTHGGVRASPCQRLLMGRATGYGGGFRSLVIFIYFFFL